MGYPWYSNHTQKAAANKLAALAFDQHCETKQERMRLVFICQNAKYEITGPTEPALLKKVQQKVRKLEEKGLTFPPELLNDISECLQLAQNEEQFLHA